MNKAHRDRIAFMRICSGKFERGMEAYHVQEGKNIKLATGTQLMAQDRAIVDEAYAGDIIGLFRPGHLLHRRHPVHRQKEGPVRGHPHLLAGALCPH